MLLIFQIQFLFPMYFIEYFLQCSFLLSIYENKLVIHIRWYIKFSFVRINTVQYFNSLRENFVILMHILAAHKSIDGTTIVYEMLFHVVAKIHFYIFVIFSAAANL